MTSSSSIGQQSTPLLPESGFLLIDKPLGVTSFDVVAACRGALHTKHVGHAGTLDPLASGLLLVGYNQGTKLLNLLTGKNKQYRTTIRLGAYTHTDDSEGFLAHHISAHPEIDTTLNQPLALQRTLADLSAHPELIRSAISEHLTGVISQVPSFFSAVKINGQRAYDIARGGHDVDIPAREVTISQFEVGEIRPVYLAEAQESLASSANSRNRVTAEKSELPVFVDVDATVTCSAGTYIRSLGRDLGRILGVGGYLTRLRRNRVGNLRVDDALQCELTDKTFRNREGETITREAVRVDLKRADNLEKCVMSVPQAVNGTLTCLPVTAHQASDLSFGRFVSTSVATLLKLGMKFESLRASGEVEHGRMTAVALKGTGEQQQAIAVVSVELKRSGELIIKPTTVLVPQMR